MRRVPLPILLLTGIAWAQPVPTRARSVRSPVTFNDQIVRILQRHCQSCHRPGDIAPFPLLTYQDAVSHARQIKTETRSRRMPPWKPVPGHGEFLDENRLTPSEIDLIERWAESGAPEGNPSDLPQPIQFADQWALGTPDLILEPDTDFKVPAEGHDVYRCFSVPTRLLQSRWVAGFDIRPGNRAVVHHVLAYPDPLGLSALRRDSTAPGYSCYGGPGVPTTSVLGGWAPGMRPRMFPEDTGIRLTASSRVVIQVHYHTAATPQTDRTRIGVYFAARPAAHEIIYVPVFPTRLVIPPGAERHEVAASLTIPRFLNGAKAISIVPHMHLLGREIRLDATYPDGSQRPLIYIDDWDFDWQAFYYYREAQALPGGTRLDLKAVYDNSAGNPRNPFNPPREVGWGEESTDEMCVIILGMILD